MSPKDEDFTLIKRELIFKIDRQTEILEGIAKEQFEHREIIYGNPVKKIRGLSERQNDLEDANKTREKWNFGMVLAIIPIVVERVWCHLTGHLK